MLFEDDPRDALALLAFGQPAVRRRGRPAIGTVEASDGAAAATHGDLGGVLDVDVGPGDVRDVAAVGVEGHGAGRFAVVPGVDAALLRAEAGIDPRAVVRELPGADEVAAASRIGWTFPTVAPVRGRRPAIFLAALVVAADQHRQRHHGRHEALHDPSTRARR